MSSDHGTHGLDALKARSLIETIWRRRTHRVSRGSDRRRRADELQEPPSARAAHAELEEAVLIAVTGCTGLTMPDRPFLRPTHRRRRSWPSPT